MGEGCGSGVGDIILFSTKTLLLVYIDSSVYLCYGTNRYGHMQHCLLWNSRYRKLWKNHSL